MRYAKIVEGKLEFTDSTKVINVNGNFARVDKTLEELDGHKPVEYDELPTANIYQKVSPFYEETISSISVHYNIVQKAKDEIIAINKKFWEDNYFQVLPIGEYYAARTNILNGVVHDLLKDDLAVMLAGMYLGQLTYIELVCSPDFSREFTNEYIDSLKTTITNPEQIGLILGYFSQLNFASREIPHLI